jgi:SAM-dependent methyltransferase
VVDERGDGGKASATGLDNEGERYVPEDYRDTYTEVEHQARYNWAAQLAAGREVLDAGCGVGWGTLRLADAGAARAVGVDIDEPALANARERANGRAEFVKGDLLALPFGDASFDFAVCFEAIEHVSDPHRALDELRRVIRPVALLAVSSPNRGVYPAGNPHHLHELTSQELEESLRHRFANVRMYRQQTHLAALLADDCAHAQANPASEISGHLYKTSGGRPGDELYTIGLASDGELPALDGVAVLGAMGLHERVNALEHQAMLAAATSAAARTEADVARERSEELARALAEERRARQEVEGWLEDLRASISWRVTSPLRAAKRAARGSRSGSG